MASTKLLLGALALSLVLLAFPANAQLADDADLSPAAVATPTTFTISPPAAPHITSHRATVSTSAISAATPASLNHGRCRHHQDSSLEGECSCRDCVCEDDVGVDRRTGAQKYADEPTAKEGAAGNLIVGIGVPSILVSLIGMVSIVAWWEARNLRSKAKVRAESESGEDSEAAISGGGEEGSGGAQKQEEARLEELVKEIVDEVRRGSDGGGRWDDVLETLRLLQRRLQRSDTNGERTDDGDALLPEYVP